MNIAISDDDKKYLYTLKNQIYMYFSNNKPCVVKTYTPNGLLDYIENKGCQYDVVCLDVKMGDYNGIEFARKISQLNPFCGIIFISSHLEWVKDVFEVSPVYFILKSELEERLPNALTKMETLMKGYASSFNVNLKNNGKTYYIPAREIVYIEVKGRKIYVHTTSDGIFSANVTLKKFSQNLPSGFIRTHNSFLINIKHILSIERTACTMTNNVSVPISRTYKSDVYEVLKQ